jgi:hypothetical protein
MSLLFNTSVCSFIYDDDDNDLSDGCDGTCQCDRNCIPASSGRT